MISNTDNNEGEEEQNFEKTKKTHNVANEEDQRSSTDFSKKTKPLLEEKPKVSNKRLDSSPPKNLKPLENHVNENGQDGTVAQSNHVENTSKLTPLLPPENPIPTLEIQNTSPSLLGNELENTKSNTRVVKEKEKSSAKKEKESYERSNEEKIHAYLVRGEDTQAEHKARALFSSLIGWNSLQFNQIAESYVRWYLDYSEEFIRIAWQESKTIAAGKGKKRLYCFIDLFDNYSDSVTLRQLVSKEQRQKAATAISKSNDNRDFKVGDEIVHVPSGNRLKFWGKDGIICFADDDTGQTLDLFMKDVVPVSEYQPASYGGYQ